MKKLHQVNIFALIITLILYLTVYLGMYAQIILGPLQLIIALIISFKYYYKLNPKLKKSILIYWALAIVSLIIAYFSWTYYKPNDFIMITVFVIPMLIACYFAYLTFNITKYLNTLKA